MTVENTTYVRGDTFPIEVVLTRASGWSLLGSTVAMNIKFDDDIVHSIPGNIKDPYKKLVEFAPNLSVTGTVRVGDYDISVDDTDYITTHMSGTISIIQDVS